MISSEIFQTTNLRAIERNLLELLNNSAVFNNPYIAKSPRSVGDTVQEVLGERMVECFPKGLIKDFSDNFARRAMADVAFTDVDDNYFVVDIKTHNRNTNFNMPNLTSVERLARLYEDDSNYFVVLLVEYASDGDGVVFDSVSLIPIENLEWTCLTIGALGWGQIQIANANVINVDRNATRKEWMLELCNVLDVFYPKEIAKIEKRLTYFERVRAFWEQK